MALTELYARVDAANAAVDAALRDQHRREREIVREQRGDPIRVWTARRKDPDLEDIGKRIAAGTADALRLAGTLQIALLGVLVRRADEQTALLAAFTRQEEKSAEVAA